VAETYRHGRVSFLFDKRIDMDSDICSHLAGINEQITGAAYDNL
jgi:hypothetical protein